MPNPFDHDPFGRGTPNSEDLLSKPLLSALLDLASQAYEGKTSVQEYYIESFNLIARDWLDRKLHLDNNVLNVVIPGMLYAIAVESKLVDFPPKKAVQVPTGERQWVSREPKYRREIVLIPEAELTEMLGEYRVTPEAKSEFLDHIHGRIVYWKGQSLSSEDAFESEDRFGSINLRQMHHSRPDSEPGPRLGNVSAAVPVQGATPAQSNNSYEGVSQVFERSSNFVAGVDGLVCEVPTTDKERNHRIAPARSGHKNGPALDVNKVARNLEYLRNLAGMSYQEIADKLHHYDHKAVWRHCHGKRVPERRTLSKYASLFSTRLNRTITIEQLQFADIANTGEPTT